MVTKVKKIKEKNNTVDGDESIKEVANRASRAVAAKDLSKKLKAKPVAASVKYNCSFFTQRTDAHAPRFCVFSASAGEVLAWSDIERLGPGVAGIQRRENTTKRRQIKKFLENDGINTIPTAVIIAFDDGKVKIDLVNNNLQVLNSGADGKNAGLIIDGQHRLLGIADYDPKIQVPIVGILNCDDVEKAFQFLVINNKGSKVSPNHMKALALNFKQKDLDKRLKLAKIVLDQDRLIHVEILNTADDSPFINRVDFPNTKGNLKKIVPEAFERALQYIESLNLPKLDDADIQRDFFIAIWKSIFNVWGEAIFSDNCRLTDKVGIVCMTRYIVDRLSSIADLEDIDLDLSELDQIELRVSKDLRRQSLDFWIVKWKGAGYDTAIGHTKVIEALTRIPRNLKDGKEWTYLVDIVA